MFLHPGAGEPRKYRVLLPAGYQDEDKRHRAYPAVLMYHGNGNCADGFALQTSMTPVQQYKRVLEFSSRYGIR